MSRWERDLLSADEPGFAPATEEAGLLAIMQRNEVPQNCERCFEFVPDSEAGRGRCLHPASGIFSPWSDTQACDFYRTRL